MNGITDEISVLNWEICNAKSWYVEREGSYTVWESYYQIKCLGLSQQKYSASILLYIKISQKNKRDKIKRVELYIKTLKGGTRMIDIEIMIIALKDPASLGF